MILPGSYLASLILLIVSLLCWGSWANTFKLTGRWRYELYYFDFAIGAFLAALIAAFTFGTLGWDGFSLFDDVRNAGKRQELFAFLGGAAFNLGNILVLASISMAGLSVALPIGMGTALIVGVIWTYFLHPGGNPVFISLGSLAVVAAIILAITAYRSQVQTMRARQTETAPAKGKSAKKTSVSKAILVAVAGGLFLGSFHQLVDASRQSENGLGPYAIALIFFAAVVASTFVYNLFLMNLPFEGQPVELGDYFKGSARQHGLGVLGGILFSAGTIAVLVVYKAEGAAHPGAAIIYAMGEGALVIGTLWGLIRWKEFAGADGRVKTFLLAMLLLLVAGIAAVALAPHFAAA